MQHLASKRIFNETNYGLMLLL